MIPKIIHYFWIGEKPLGEKEIKCMESWKRFCPDYEIKLWNEKNYDFSIFLLQNVLTRHGNCGLSATLIIKTQTYH